MPKRKFESALLACLLPACLALEEKRENQLQLPSLLSMPSSCHFSNLVVSTPILASQTLTPLARIYQW